MIYRAVQNEPRKDNVVIKEKSPAPQPPVKPEGQDRKNVIEPEPRRKSPAPRHRRVDRAQPDRFQPDRPFIRDSITAYSNDGEYTSDFFLLNLGAAQAPMESGEVLRVQMPRSALVRFGLPVNVEQADVPVKADLLVGEDGLARAIRFVR